MDELKKQAEELGIKVDGRWSAERLQAEIDEALAKDPVDAPEAPTDPGEPEPEPEPDLTEANAEIEAERQARFDAQQAESVGDGSITLINLQANPMSALGLESYGEVSVTEAQMACPRFAGKVQRAKDLGLIRVK